MIVFAGEKLYVSITRGLPSSSDALSIRRPLLSKVVANNHSGSADTKEKASDLVRPCGHHGERTHRYGSLALTGSPQRLKMQLRTEIL